MEVQDKTSEILRDPVWYPYTPIPFKGPREKIKSASLQYVYTQSGHKLFDGTSSWWCQLHGHSHPRLVKALQRQAEVLDHVMMAPHCHAPAQELAGALIEAMGKPFEKVFFSDDGSTAVEVAIKILMQYWQLKGENRKRFLSLKEAYHGDTLGAVALSGTEYFHGHFKEKNSHFQGEAPYCFRCPVGKTYPSCKIACLGSVREALRANPKQFAGAIIEPLVLGAGGMLIYPQEYLEAFVGLCKEYQVPVIFDEVFTGFGRTGTLFAYEQISLRPDIVCLSKGLTSGMLALGATVTTEEFFKEFVGSPEKAFYHGHTFTGNPLACAVAIESLKLLQEENVLERNKSLSLIMHNQRERFSNLPIVADVRHLGMIWAVELKTVGNALGWEVCQKLWEKGYWLRPLHQMLYLIPPYASTTEDLEGVFQALYDLLTPLKADSL